MECVWVGGACVLLGLGCSVQLGVAVPETRTGFWDGEVQVPASMMFFHGVGFSVAVCAGSRAAACASISPWSPATAAPRLEESTRLWHPRVTNTLMQYQGQGDR